MNIRFFFVPYEVLDKEGQTIIKAFTIEKTDDGRFIHGAEITSRMTQTLQAENNQVGAVVLTSLPVEMSAQDAFDFLGLGMLKKEDNE
jgi:hypothetical protein